ncbi:MAG: helix-turn-helix transcriptional regulator [Macromonas sp.]
MLDFVFATPQEICSELAARLKTARLTLGLQQAEVAARAGVSRGTVIALENTGHGTLQSLVRVALALGLADQLEPLFQLNLHSIAQMEQASTAPRQRVRKAAAP